MSRKKTISKVFYDDEIIGRLPDGDLILKPGVRRKYYDSFDGDLTADTHINYEVINSAKHKDIMDKHFNDEVNTGEIDNWDTE
jgi:hypothetical protein